MRKLKVGDVLVSREGSRRPNSKIHILKVYKGITPSYKYYYSKRKGEEFDEDKRRYIQRRVDHEWVEEHFKLSNINLSKIKDIYE